MNWALAGNRSVVQRLLQLGFAAAVLAALAGCAAHSGSELPSAGTDITTESDLTPARKLAQIRLDLAVDYYKRGQTKVALDEVKRALVADPNFAEAYNMRGLIYMRLEDYPLADDSFRRALALKPRDGAILHNYGWMLCQQKHFARADEQFQKALAIPSYGDRAKTLKAQGVCQLQAGEKKQAEATLARAYEFDAGDPVVGYNLAELMFERNDLKRAQFYIGRINNTELANAQSLWLGIRIDRRLGDRTAMARLGDQLQQKFPDSPEATAYQQGRFDE
ncbi:MAG: Type IV pilus biogenesis protein PilF [Burkholderiaceae bacterium]|jgi:type IV pilus assembly protein PilF|nr:MAG: Type IV pilus biogenesis protein PilF [Burkholderiaceae bacterium]